MTKSVKVAAGEEYTPRIRWTEEEAKLVAMSFMPLKFAAPHLTTPQLIEKAQEVLPLERQRTAIGDSSSYAVATRLTNFWNEFARINPERAQRALAEAKTPPEKPKEPKSIVNFAAPVEAPPEVIAPLVTAEFEQPTATPVAVAAPPAPILGPLEMALQAMVQRANEGNLMTIIQHIDAKFEVMRDELQELVNAQHDSLLSYFDPEFKRQREVQAEYVADGISKARDKLEAGRVRKKQILVVCTNNVAGIQRTLEPKFAGIDFTFIDGGANKLKAHGYYDLVLCNATNRPAVREKLVILHGQKVVYTDGGTASMIETIRKKLAI